jgi:N-acetyl-gamma-glutamyl-phosphate reductase
LGTLYAKLVREMTTAEARAVYQDFYGNAGFVRLLPEGQWPHTKWVFGSNFCHLNLIIDSRTNRLVVASAIDNLVKGAAGQAVQNMNIMFGLPEETGLNYPGLNP